MALARACLKSAELLQRRTHATTLYSCTSGISRLNNTNNVACKTTPLISHRNYSSSSAQEVAIKTDQSSSVTQSGRDRKWRSPWQLTDNIGVGNALMQVSQNLNRLLENWLPSRLLGRVKEDDKCYKLRYEVPGLGKDDVKITVENGYLVITGESKLEDEDEGDDGWYSHRYGYGYYNTSVLLPDDAKVEDIKAELKDGILTIYIPRTGEKSSNVREIKIE